MDFVNVVDTIIYVFGVVAVLIFGYIVLRKFINIVFGVY